MTIREFPEANNEQAHREWLTNATIEELDAYIPVYSATPTFYRMALAQREKLYFHKLNKPHWTMTPMFWIVLLSLFLTLLLDWKKIVSSFESFFLFVWNL